MEKTAKNGREKVELKLNQPVKLRLLKGRPFEGKSAYGPYLLYSVEEQGVEKAYFAPPEVHQQIAELRCGEGDEIQLTKVAEENGKKGVSKIIVERLSVASRSNGNASEDNFRSTMEQALKDAIEITKSAAGVSFGSQDIEKMATTIFIARTRTQ